VDRKGRQVRPQAIVTPHQRREARKRLEAGETQRSIARSYHDMTPGLAAR
jgi:hypothetical protein